MCGGGGLATFGRAEKHPLMYFALETGLHWKTVGVVNGSLDCGIMLILRCGQGNPELCTAEINI